jgi:hypothetical protein
MIWETRRACKALVRNCDSRSRLLENPRDVDEGQPRVRVVNRL